MSFHGMGLGEVDVTASAQSAGVDKFKTEIKSGQTAGESAEAAANAAGEAAASTGGAAAGVAACAATGVGTALAPLCGVVGAAIGKFLYDDLGPFIGDVGDAIGSLFHSSAEAEAEKARRDREVQVLHVFAQMQVIEDRANHLLNDAVARIVALHNQIGLPGPYGWFEATQALKKYGTALVPLLSAKPSEMGKPVLSWYDSYSKQQISLYQWVAPYWFEQWAPWPPYPHVAEPCLGQPSPTPERFAACMESAKGRLRSYDAWIRQLQYSTAQVIAALGAEGAALHVQQQMAQASRDAKTAKEKFDAAGMHLAQPGIGQPIAVVGAVAFAGAFALTWLLKK
jgi:hypothetical protein